MKKSLHFKEYTKTIFLDIEGIFGNVNLAAIAGALNSLNLEQDLVRFIELLYKLRVVTSTVGGLHIVRELSVEVHRSRAVLYYISSSLESRSQLTLRNNVIAYADNIAIVLRREYIHGR